MTYWYEVGVHPGPTEDDLPVIVQRASIGAIRARPVVFDSYMPEIVAGDRWTHVTLPSETAPPPEEEGVEVDGVRWKVGSGPMGSGVDYVFAHAGTGVWAQMERVDSYKRKATVAIALGLVDPPVPADVQRVVDAAKALRTRMRQMRMEHDDAGWREVFSDQLRDLLRDVDVAVDALDSPAPVPADTSDPEAEPTTGPWRYIVERDMTVHRCWRVIDHGNHRATVASCGDEADAIKVRDALNASPSWPPMRPMSELADEHAEPVLIAYGGSRFCTLAGTLRENDADQGRVGWWPLPTVEEEGT